MSRKLLLLCLIAILIFCGCGQRYNDASDLLAPLPKEGIKVAAIGNEDYLYDSLYLFRLCQGIKPEEPTKKSINYAVETEICAAEAVASGLTFSKEDYDSTLRYWKDLPENYTATIKEKQSLLNDSNSSLSKEEKQFYKRDIEREQAMVKQYTSCLNAILEKEDISEDEFWERESPYIEKGLYALAYGEKLCYDYIAEHGEADSGYEAYVKKQMEELKTKYDVNLVK